MLGVVVLELAKVFGIAVLHSVIVYECLLVKRYIYRMFFLVEQSFYIIVTNRISLPSWLPGCASDSTRRESMKVKDLKKLLENAPDDK